MCIYTLTRTDFETYNSREQERKWISRDLLVNVISLQARHPNARGTAASLIVVQTFISSTPIQFLSFAVANSRNLQTKVGP